MCLQALLLSRMNSQNIVSCRGSGMASTHDVYWIEMELLNGATLEKVLEDEGPLPEREVIKVPKHKTQGLQASKRGHKSVGD